MNRKANLEQLSLFIGEPPSPIKERKSKRGPKLNLSRKVIAPLLRFDQCDFCNATQWITWVNEYRQRLGLNKKKIRDFKRRVGGTEVDKIKAAIADSIGGAVTPIEIQIFRAGGSRYEGVWIPRALLPDLLRWLSENTDAVLHIPYNAGKWQRWESRCFTDAQNRVIPPAPVELQNQAGKLFKELCDRLYQWREANPGLTSCKGGALFNAYSGYLTKGLYGMSLTQLKRHLMLKSSDSIHAHLPEQWLRPLVAAYQQGVDAIAPDLDKPALKSALAAAGEAQKLDSSSQLLLI